MYKEKKAIKLKIRISKTTINSKKTIYEHKYIKYADIVTLGLSLYFHHFMLQFFDLKL